MPASTPQGLPYPLPTEPVAEGAQAIRNLAEAVDPQLPFGGEYYNAAAAGIPSAVTTRIPLDTVAHERDPAGLLSVSGGLIVPAQAGYYLVMGRVTWPSNATGQRVVILDVASTEVARSVAPAAFAVGGHSVGWLVGASAGQGIGLLCYQDSGTTLVVPAALSVTRLWQWLT